MMRSKYRSALVALVAVLALGALASASASAALPEFVPGIFPTKFSGTSKGTIQFEEATGTYSCESSSSITGTIASATSLTGVVIKLNCNGSGSIICQQNIGSVELETSELKGRIAYTSKASKVVGLLLEPVTEPVSVCFATDDEPAEIRGSLIGEITPINKPTKTFTLHYKQHSHVQTLRRFEGEEALHNLTILRAGFPGESREVGFEGSLTLTPAHEMELKA